MSFKLMIILLVTGTVESFGQVEEIKFYQTAYNYLSDSVVKKNYPDVKTLAKNCIECCIKGAEVEFDFKLQVSEKFIRNDRGFPMCDLLKRKYQMNESCAVALGSGTVELTKQVQDSLKIFWKNYKMKQKSDLLKILKDMVSNKKDGYQVFFSDVHKNTLAAELKSFCLPYDEAIWFGSSTSFFFIFNQDGEIEEVYSGETIHYN